MKISLFEIQNFRKLKSCRVEMTPRETILVGANNSGKTSAIDAIRLFLKKSNRKNIATTDFTLSNWSDINQIGTQWVDTKKGTAANPSLGQWLPYLPTIDIWIHANDADIHHVAHLLPTLDWRETESLDGNFGVNRLQECTSVS